LSGGKLLNLKSKYPYYPIFGLISYVFLFSIAVNKYPGGSINDMASEGYSFFHNFLCDLMLSITENGNTNHARPIAIIGHLMLSFAMISFFYILPEIFSYKNLNTLLIRCFGVLTMSIFIFMYTQYHDLVVTLTGMFGIAALLPFMLEMRSYEVRGLKLLSYLCIALSLIVFISFETKIGFYYLPFLQKITFLFDAWWVVWVSLIVAKKRKEYLAEA